MRNVWLGVGGILAFLVINSYTGIVAPTNVGVLGNKS
jgi:hypothetical protein